MGKPMTDSRQDALPRSELDDLEMVDLRAEPYLGISAVVSEDQLPLSARLDLWGELTEATAPNLARMVDALLDDGVNVLHVNLFGVVRCTAGAAEVVLGARRQTEAHGGTMRVYNARGSVRHALEDADIPPDVTLGPAAGDR